MKVIVFGATGKVGGHLVDQALSEGHEVTAFVRKPRRFSRTHENLHVIKGDVLDVRSVGHAVEGHDAVLCALGMPLMNKDGLRAKGTANIVSAMQQSGVKRLVCLSGLGVGDSRDIMPLHYKYFIVPFIFGRVYTDHQIQEAIIENSALDWIIARPSNFTEGERTGTYHHGFTAIDKSLKLKISQGDVADFMLQQLGSDTYLYQAPGLSN